MHTRAQTKARTRKLASHNHLASISPSFPTTRSQRVVTDIERETHLITLITIPDAQKLLLGDFEDQPLETNDVEYCSARSARFRHFSHSYEQSLTIYTYIFSLDIGVFLLDQTP